MPNPDLVLDALYVVGCHLAGMHAFGSLASLHIASRDVADIVLPILHETVLADSIENLPFRSDKEVDPPNRFRYTKFVIRTENIGPLPRIFDKVTMPNLVAVIYISYKYSLEEAAIVDAELSTILRKPISAATLYGIIALTPGHCRASVEMKRCDMPRVSSIFILESGFLIPDATVNSSWTTSIRLLNTTFPGRVAGDCRELDTIFELLKLVGRTERAQLRTSERSQYQGRKEDATYHLELNMTEEGYHAFAERFVSETLLHPEIFLNRISMNITDGMVPRDVFITLLDDLLDVYTTRVTSCDEIRPIWGLSHTLLTLRADTLTREERQRERANALRGDIYPGREHAIRRLGPQSLATGESIIALRSRIKK